MSSQLVDGIPADLGEDLVEVEQVAQNFQEVVEFLWNLQSSGPWLHYGKIALWIRDLGPKWKQRQS